MSGTTNLTHASTAEEGLSVHLYNKRDITLVRGEGMYLWDSEGKRYLDMMSNYGVAILGHAHPAVTHAIREQAGLLISAHQSFYNDQRSRFLETLARFLPPDLRHLSFANSGAEANEAALKFARLATGRQCFVSTKRGYHGRTFGALSVTGEPKHATPFAPLLEGCVQVPFGDLDAAREALQGAAAMILEPVQGESGVRVASVEYLRGLRTVCDEVGALLILDEVQTAFRTGRTWCWEHSGVKPDIMTLSKPLANGLPIGITAASGQVAEAVGPGSHGTTFGGNPLVCAAGVATLEIIGEPGFNERVARLGQAFLDGLRAVRHPGIREVRGLGLMIAAELKSSVSPVLQRMQAAGVLAISAGKTNVRFLPPLIAEEEHVSEAIRVFEASL
jgi:LysW-gamma-L-lysine/LysW-L-ornithine aminotransferase